MFVGAISGGNVAMIGSGLLEGGTLVTVDSGEAVMLVAVDGAATVAVLVGRASIAALVRIMTVGVGETAIESSKMKLAAPIQASRPTASTPITL